MINPTNVIKILMDKCESYSFPPSASTPEDFSFSDVIWNIIHNKYTGSCEIFEDEYLYDAENVSDNSDSESENESSDSDKHSTSSYEPSPVKKHMQSISKEFSRETMERIAEYHERRGTSATLKRYKKLNNDNKKIVRIKSFLANNGNRLSKFDQLKAMIYVRYRANREAFLPVHGHDLKAWALDSARTLQIQNLTATDAYIEKLKKEFRITSRKITKFVTKKTKDNEQEIRQSAIDFTETINNKKEQFDDSNVWNTDQSGFNYEITSNRTLSDKGEKDTFALVNNINSLTHSYTIQVLISNAGILAPKIFICFQERTGTFGPLVLRRIEAEKPDNVEVTCTTSGKMTKKTLEIWVEKCLNPLVATKTMLIQDSWSAQKDTEIFNAKLDNYSNLQIETIPPKATKYCQPLDVYFFRQYKLFVRRFQDAVRASIGDEFINKLNDRAFIMKMHSFVYNQLSSASYHNMLLYAWKASGFTIQEEIPRFKSVLEVNFGSKSDGCSFPECQRLVFTKCSTCSKSLCPKHCIDPLHLH